MKFVNIKGIIVLLIILLALQLGFGLVLSPIVSKVVIDKLNDYGKTKIMVDGVNIWPLTLSASIKGIKVFDPDDEKKRIIEIPKTNLRISVIGLLSKRFVIAGIKVSNAVITVKGEADGTFNIQKVIPGSETEKKGTSFFDRFKGKKDWFSMIYNMIKKRTSSESIEKKKEEKAESRKIKKEVVELPKGRRVFFRRAGEGYVFEIKKLILDNATIKLEADSNSEISLQRVSVDIRGLGVDPERGAKLSSAVIKGDFKQNDINAGRIKIKYSQGFDKYSLKTSVFMSGDDIDLPATSFIYKNSIPVEIKKGRITFKSNTVMNNDNIDSDNKITITGQEFLPGSGKKISLNLVPLPVLCKAINNVDPLKFSFQISGTLEQPQFKGFEDALMSVLKPQLSDITESVKKEGLNTIKSFFNK